MDYTSDRVLVVHSRKYWKSPYCLYEFWQTWQRFCTSDKCIKDTFILVGLPDSRVFDDTLREGYRQFWDEWHSMYRQLWNKELTSKEIEEMKSIPVRLADLWPVRDLFGRVDTVFRDYIGQLHQMSEYGKRWEKGSEDKVVEWIREEIGLNSPRSKK